MILLKRNWKGDGAPIIARGAKDLEAEFRSQGPEFRTQKAESRMEEGAFTGGSLLECEVAEVSQGGPDERAGHHVAQEMHAEQDPRRGHAHGAEE